MVLGAGVGAGVALASSRLTASLLYGTGPRDLVRLATVGLLVVVIASAGSALPALWAASYRREAV